MQCAAKWYSFDGGHNNDLYSCQAGNSYQHHTAVHAVSFLDKSTVLCQFCYCFVSHILEKFNCTGVVFIKTGVTESKLSAVPSLQRLLQPNNRFKYTLKVVIINNE